MHRNKSNNITNIGIITCMSAKFLVEMSKITQTDYPTFSQMYKALPERSSVSTPKSEFVKRAAALTKKSEKTIRCWIAGTQKPDALAQSILEKEYNVPATYLFPLKK